MGFAAAGIRRRIFVRGTDYFYNIRAPTYYKEE